MERYLCVTALICVNQYRMMAKLTLIGAIDCAGKNVEQSAKWLRSDGALHEPSPRDYDS